MAMTIVESTRPVTGGVDTHLDVHVAAALDSNGGVLGVESFPTTPAGYRDLHAWLAGFGELHRVGVEGTGAYGAGLARFLQRAGLEVIEVDRPNRQQRRRNGKSDQLDAIEAGRAVLGGRCSAVAKTGDGAMEAMRTLLVAKRSAREARVSSLNQIRHLGVTGPEDLRARLASASSGRLAGVAASLRPTRDGDPMRYGTKLALRTLGRRVLELDTQLDELNNAIGALVTATAPGLLALHGVGVDTAATLLVAAGDNPHRIRSEAAWAHLCGVAPLPAGSGKTNGRVRLNPGGNRQANHALWRIVITRMSTDPRTRRYVTRRLDEGLNKREIIRVLKRYVARETYRHLPR
jgi:transposase